jgi:drug/metabolite transporter (DMT)-like permease
VTRTILYTSLALVAFALNSILCRTALRGGEADAAGFTALRLASGAVALIAIDYFFGAAPSSLSKRGNWSSAFFLFAYAVCFSFAYLGLTAGTGALILFGAVQITMIAWVIVQGERPTVLESLGIFLAAFGLVYLVFPGLAAPSGGSAALMAMAGASWGAYTLRGRASANPLGDTTGNFLRSIPMVGLTILPFLSQLHLSGRGVLLAVLSGALASGMGYTVWYAALKSLTSSRAAVLQLAVPVLAALLGGIFLKESMTIRLAGAMVLILGGIGLTIAGKRRTLQPKAIR